MADESFQPRAAFAGFSGQGAITPPGVTATERVGLGLATILCRDGQESALRERVRKLHGIDLPNDPRFVQTGGIGIVCTAPGVWLAIDPDRPNEVATDLSQDLAGVAAIADQSDAYAVLRLTGPHLRDALAKGFTIDLHPDRFAPGDAAVTMAAHIGAILWRPVLPTGEDAFDVAIFRSFAASFWHWLADSAAEYGFAVGASK